MGQLVRPAGCPAGCPAQPAGDGGDLALSLAGPPATRPEPRRSPVPVPRGESERVGGDPPSTRWARTTRPGPVFRRVRRGGSVGLVARAVASPAAGAGPRRPAPVTNPSRPALIVRRHVRGRAAPAGSTAPAREGRGPAVRAPASEDPLPV
ncbi:hypothetical protein C1701_21375 [Actinoalloteichus sp. AHMU CJ021]|nr:hypothetical protein C1701_21375 [Actinoalloteichus sp. AHMU CJ021]